MATLKSRYRKLFIAKIITFSILAVFFAFLCFYNSVDENGEIFSRSLFAAGIVIVLLSLVGIIQLSQISRLSVTNHQITNTKILGGKKTTIRFEEIKAIESAKTRAQGPIGYINDGYYSARISSNSDATILISPDDYENSDELISFVLKKYRNEA
ncbi:MAG TPA: hypothetical protein VF676_03205 [Flavobacterium sp.]|jgi:hypothetical protein